MSTSRSTNLAPADVLAEQLDIQVAIVVGDRALGRSVVGRYWRFSSWARTFLWIPVISSEEYSVTAR